MFTTKWFGDKKMPTSTELMLPVMKEAKVDPDKAVVVDALVVAPEVADALTWLIENCGTEGWCITGHIPIGNSGLGLSATTPQKIGTIDLHNGLMSANKDFLVGFTVAFMNKNDAMRFKMVWA